MELKSDGEDHPRIRGEHDKHRHQLLVVPRIIPAYAGSTVESSVIVSKDYGSSPHTRGARTNRRGLSPCHQDHPRIRGEHFVLMSHAKST